MYIYVYGTAYRPSGPTGRALFSFVLVQFSPTAEACRPALTFQFLKALSTFLLEVLDTDM
jgi:hypothetical protein